MKGWIMRLRAASRTLLLLAALGAWAGSPRAQETSGVLAGADTAESSQKAKGMPWIAHSSAEAFYLASPSSTGSGQPYQVAAYQGFTIQSLSFASFHLGWRYRETLALDMNESYRDLFALKVMGTAEILRDHLFFSIGGTIPLVDASVTAADTAALFQAMNGYNPLPTPDFAMPQGLQVSLVGRYRLGSWDLMAGGTYVQPTLFEPVEDYPFHPAARVGGNFRALLETELSRHRWEARVFRYGIEETVREVAAHREGFLAELRYSWLKSSGRSAWQLGLGGLAKGIDLNRPLLLPTPLEPSDGNDNIQRAYAEAAWSWTPRPSMLWRAWLVPKALLEGSTRETGFETELGLGLGLRLWEVHRLRASGNLLAGSFQGQDYLGFGMRFEFAFRHLGFQDLEAQPESGEGS